MPYVAVPVTVLKRHRLNTSPDLPLTATHKRVEGRSRMRQAFVTICFFLLQCFSEKMRPVDAYMLLESHRHSCAQTATGGFQLAREVETKY
jgi:hypothetical protein